MLAVMRSWLRLLLLVLASAGLAAPALAWSAHDIQHAGQPVAVDQHHHHDAEEGIVITHDAHDSGGALGDSSGHDHMPRLLAGQAALLESPVGLSPSVLGRPAYFSSVRKGLVQPPGERLKRPPRFA